MSHSDLALITGCLAAITTLAGITHAVLIRRQRHAARRRARAHHATPPAVDTQPGRDTDLLLACIEAWDDPAGYRRLRNAINQHRKEEQ